MCVSLGHLIFEKYFKDITPDNTISLNIAKCLRNIRHALKNYIYKKHILLNINNVPSIIFCSLAEILTCIVETSNVFARNASPFSGDERDGAEAMAKHSGLVHHVLRRAVDRDAVDRYNFIGWQDPAAIESSADTPAALRLHLLDSDFLVGEHHDLSFSHSHEMIRARASVLVLIAANLD